MASKRERETRECEGIEWKFFYDDSVLSCWFESRCHCGSSRTMKTQSWCMCGRAKNDPATTQSIPNRSSPHRLVPFSVSHHIHVHVKCIRRPTQHPDLDVRCGGAVHIITNSTRERLDANTPSAVQAGRRGTVCLRDGCCPGVVVAESVKRSTTRKEQQASASQTACEGATPQAAKVCVEHGRGQYC